MGNIYLDPTKYAGYGMPGNNPTPVATNLLTQNPNDNIRSSWFDQLDKMADEFGQGFSYSMHNIGDFFGDVGHVAEAGVEKGYSAVKTVLSDAKHGVGDVIDSGFNKLLITMVVVIGGVVLIARSGAFKANVSVPMI